MYSTQEFGILTQKQHPDKIFIISWEDCKTEMVLSPSFYFFNNIDDVIKYVGTHFETPLRLVSQDDFVDCLISVGGNTAVLFDDERKIFMMYHYKEDYIAFQCYIDDVYLKLKTKLSEGTIPPDGIFIEL